MTTLRELAATFEQLWPAAGADNWDAPGLIAGALDAPIERVLLTVDITSELVDEAADGYDLVLAHHPYLLRGVSLLGENTTKGAVIAKAIRGNLALFAAHTNADIVADGVSDVIAKSFGLFEIRPLVDSGDANVGHGRIGRLAKPIALGEFARHIAKVLPATASGVRVAGNYSDLIQSVALCGGAGDSFISHAAAAGADVFVTSDLRHHAVQEARESSLAAQQPLNLIDVSHWASEWLWLSVAASQLRERHPSVYFEVSDLRTDPFDFVITQ